MNLVKDPKKRLEIEISMRNIMMLNDNDDKADVRDEIAETKGIKRKVNEDYRTKLRLVPRE